MRIVLPSALAGALLLSACVPQTTEQGPPPPRLPVVLPETPPPPPVASEDWRDIPVTPGGWTWRNDARGSVAMFGVAGLDAQLVIRCDRATRRIYVSRPGALAVGQEAIMAITTSAGTASYRAQPTGGTPPYVAIQLGTTDPFLDKIAFSRGRFVIATTGFSRLVVPSWPEFGRVVEDCRK